MSFNTWNNIDDLGSYLGLERLESETDESYIKRIKEFNRWLYRQDYYSLSHSIPLQLSLDTYKAFKIESNTQYTCKIDTEYFYLENSTENVRVFINTPDAKVSKIINAINNCNTMNAIVYNEDYLSYSCKYIIRNTNIKITTDYIDTTRSMLLNNNIVQDSLYSKNQILRSRKTKPSDIKRSGDFYLNEKTGYLEFNYPDFQGDYFTYKYYDPNFMVELTDVNLTPMNDIFKYGITKSSINALTYLLNNRVFI